MPIYDFKCNKCGEVSEFLDRGANQIPTCPECGSNDMEKLIPSSYSVRMGSHTSGTTCCGRDDRCDSPPCSKGNSCRRHQ